jgi:hypothetical protein
MTLQQAKDFINYNIKEGIYEAEDFKGMTNGELIGFAEDEDMRAELAFDALKDDEALRAFGRI